MSTVLPPPVQDETTHPTPPAGGDTGHRAAGVARQLAWAEARRLLRSPILWTGFVLGGLLVVQDLRWPDVADRHNYGGGVFYALLPAAVTLIAANRAALRVHRDGTGELFDAAPASHRARTAGHLLALVAPLVLGLLLAAGWVATIFVTEGFGRPVVADVLRGPVLVAGAGALGVLLARWIRSALAGPVACVAIAASIIIMMGPAFTVRSQQWLSLFPSGGDLPIPELTMTRPYWWHLVYLVGLVALAGLGALIRDGLDRAVVVPSVVVLALVAVSAFVVTRPDTAEDWARRDALLADPAAHQHCVEQGGATYCHHPRYEPLIDWWSRPVEGVLARVPGQASAGVVVRQRLRPSADLPWLADDARERIAAVLPSLPQPGEQPPDDGAVTVPFSWEAGGPDDVVLAWQVAGRTVGLPVVAPAPRAPCDAAGQARGAVALWLAGQSTPDAGRAMADALGRGAWANPVAGGRLVPSRRHLGADVSDQDGAVAIGADEAALAVALLDRPVADVARALAPHWESLRQPSFSTDELAGLLGVEPAPAPPLRPAFGSHVPLLGRSGSCT